MDRIRISDLARLGTATDTLDASINNVSDPCAVEEPNISAMSLHGESDDDQKRGHLLPNNQRCHGVAVDSRES